jgi:uncharacterized protein YjlB
MSAASIPPEMFHFENDGSIPNSRLPLLLYRGEFAETGERGAVWVEETFARNGWSNSWRNGVYPYHHYHPNTHEVLGIYQGSALLCLGGESGREIEVRAGDVIVIPAGVGHKNLGASSDFAVVGAYPDGMSPDLGKEDPRSIEDALKRIAGVPLPDADPVRGTNGGLKEIWR